MREELAPADAKVADIAKRQFGIVSHGQLAGAGLSPSGISRRVSSGRLYRIYRGVYAVGHAGLSSHARWMAAALACGQDAVVSHRSAAELWQLLKPRDGPVHITVPNRSGRARRAGIRLHRRRAFDSAQATRRWRIPVTTPARTISDLRRNLPAYEVRHAVRQAEVLGLPLGEMSSDRTRSDLERDFLKICRRHQLPAPEVNVELGTYEADFLWRDRRIIVETDSYRYHRGWQAFKDDHARDLELRQRGFEVFRFSEAQINEEAERVASFLRGVLASRPHRVGADGE